MNGFDILIAKASIVLPREVSNLKKGARAEVDFPKKKKRHKKNK